MTPRTLKLKMEISSNQARLIFSGDVEDIVPLREYLRLEKLPGKENYIPNKTYHIAPGGKAWGVQQPNSVAPTQVRVDYWFHSVTDLKGNYASWAYQYISMLIKSVGDCLATDGAKVAKVKLIDLAKLKTYTYFNPSFANDIDVSPALAKSCCDAFLKAVDEHRLIYREDKTPTVISTFDEDKGFVKPSQMGIKQMRSIKKVPTETKTKPPLKSFYSRGKEYAGNFFRAQPKPPQPSKEYNQPLTFSVPFVMF